MQLFRKLHVSSLLKQDKNTSLKKVLGPFELILFGVGCIIGTGIFVVPGIVASQNAGPATVLSFVLASFACILAALCYSEFAATFPKTGSAYVYSYAVFGEIIGWLVAWLLVLEYGVGSAAIAGGWSAYFRSFLEGIGIHIPTALSGPFNPEKGTYFDLLAVLIILIISALLCKGVKESLRVTNIMVVIKLAVILLFIIVGAFYVKPENWTPFMPFGFSGVSAGASIVFFTFIGFDAVASAAEEVKNPQRNMPIGIIGSLTVVAIFYIAVSLVLTGIVPYEMLNVAAPVAFALQFIGQDWLAGLLSLGAIVGITTILLGLLYGQSRLFLALSRDGLLPTSFSKINPKTKTPVNTTIWTGILVALVGGIVPLNKLLEIINIGTLTAFSLVALGVLVFRKTHPEVKRGFKVPFIPVIPILAILACGYLIFNLPLLTFITFAVWIAIGIMVYFLYGYQNSVLGKKQTNMKKNNNIGENKEL